MDQVTTCWVFLSGTRADLTHRTMLHASGDIACTCEGWSLREQADGSRNCKHCGWVKDGTADQKAVKRYDYPAKEKVTDMTQKTISTVWVFASSSGSGTYQTIRYADGSTSCDCRGWTQRVAADGGRSCKHTRYVDTGMADRESLSKKDYGATILQPVIPAKVSKNQPSAPAPIVTPGSRKFRLDD